MRTLSVRLDDQTDALLRAYCARFGVTQTEALKAGIVALAETAHVPSRLAASMDLIGCFDSGSGDLGRNHSARLKEKLATARRRG